MLRDLQSCKPYVLEHFTDERYRAFLQVLYKDDYIAALPTLQILIKEIGISSKKFHSLLRELFEAVSINEIPMKVNQTVCVFEYVSEDKVLSFQMEGLLHIPNIGDRIELPFFARCFNNLYVKEVNHKIEINGSHKLTFMLTRNAPNFFWKFRKDEALLKKEITLQEDFEDDWLLQRKLNLGVRFKVNS